MPEKKLLFSKTEAFLKQRRDSLHKYIKEMIIIHEVVSNPIFQKFLRVDVNYDPNYEYSPIVHIPDTNRIEIES